MKRILYGVVIMGLVFGSGSGSHDIISSQETVTVSRNILVSHPGSVRPEEVVICINPKNPNNLVAGANLDFFYHSMDGGFTWTEGRLSSPLGVWGDPCVIADDEGNFYYGHLSNPVEGEWIDRIVVQKSTDGGATWNQGAGIGLNPPKDQDKEWLAADITDSPYRNNLYAAWTEFDRYGSDDPEDRTRILAARSIDSGVHWSDPVVVSDVTGNCLDSDETVEGAVPAVGPKGEIYLCWAGPLGLTFDKSLDGGQTFGEDIPVTPLPGGWDIDVAGIYRCNGMPITACDISDSPYRGHIYILWSDQRNGVGDTDVFLVKSADGGKTWGSVTRVNDDPPGRQQFFPWMTIDQKTGYIYAVFYDRRDSTDYSTEIYLARSDDGGRTFTNHKISDYPFNPVSGIFFGDYIGIAADGGMIYPIWARMDGVDLSIWTAVVTDGAARR